MKKRIYSLMAMTLSIAMLAGCGNAKKNDVAQEQAVVKSVAEIKYSNVNYNFESDIAKEKETLALAPQAANVSLSVADSKGATGVVLTPSVEEGNTLDLYLNAMVAGNELTFKSEGNEITTASSSIAGELTVNGGTVKVIPQALNAADPVDEVISFTLKDGKTYNVHTVNVSMADINITNMDVSEADAGVYTFAIDKFLLRVNTKGELVYYRSMLCVGENMCEGFAPQATKDGRFYTYFSELRPEYRNSNGGYSSGMYVVMDENYVEKDHVTMLPNDDKNHSHGEGYLDQHEFTVLGEDHYLTLSYTPEHVENIPESTGVTSGYVWAGVFQEVKDDKVVWEISTTDYPLLYESAVEKFDYAGSTDQGIELTNRQGQTVQVLADGWMDYVHVNSLDYTLDGKGNLNKLLVSMRDQSAVYQFDIPTAGIEWILGGKASTLTGYDEFAKTRTDDQKKAEFNALTYGQHHARYLNKNEDGTLTGNAEISIFDNQTGDAPFLKAVPVPTATRTMQATIDVTAKTAQIHDIVTADDMDKLTDRYHNASHCGSVQYQSDTSVVIGWGLHGVIDTIPAMAPAGTMKDIGYDDLKMGSRPIFTEYDKANGKVTFELSTVRNKNIHSAEGMFSYRTYKTAN